MRRDQDSEEIREAIRAKYRRVARGADGLFPYPTGAAGALSLGYDPEVLAGATPELLRSFCGVGNPFALGEIREGESVLDVGCGAGFDLYVASRRAGPTGRVQGVDLTPEMVAESRENIARCGLGNAEARLGGAESLPFAPDTFDVVISNGVLNLCPRKDRAFDEIFRVLRPGGRLQFADVILDGDLPAEVAGSLDAWSD